MAKNCIICGKPAGSREHVFPAALGGRRVNKGIYCGIHNGAFSSLAGILSDQLAAINAFLAVRPDHADEPRQLAIVNPSDGHKYLVSATNVEQAGPIIRKDTIINGARHVQAQFSNERQIQDWLAEQRKAGMKVEIHKREEGMKYFTQPYLVQLVLGGIEGLKAIGYIALTFLAHYFPQAARQPELETFKGFIQGVNGEQPVWWNFGGLPGDIPQNAFRFGHRILVGLSASRQQAYAHISLFSTLDFAVVFGSLHVGTDQTVVVDIDPQADNAPGDITETRTSTALGGVDRPASWISSLSETIESGKGRELFERLLTKIFDWQRECLAKQLLTKINATKSLGDYERFQQVKRLLSERGQSILNLMLFTANGLNQLLGADQATAALVPLVDALVAADPESANGISQLTACTLELATAALAEQVCRDHVDGKLDWERLSLLLGGGPGASIVAKVILKPFMAALGTSLAEMPGWS